MKLANLIRKRPREAVATAIPAIPAIPATEPGSRVAAVAKIATVAVAKSDEGGVEGAASSIQDTHWLVHFLDREPTEVWYGSAATHAEVLTQYGDAVAAEPVPKRTDTHMATVIERDELLALVRAIYADDTDQDGQEAIDAALADPAGALTCYRAVAAERGMTVARADARQSAQLSAHQSAARACSTCRHRKRPGLSVGYCGGREDLPGAYGDHHPLRKLPDDQGVTCDRYRPHEG